MINLNLYKMEFYRYRNSMIIWALVICSLIILDMALFQIFLNDGMIEKMKPMMDSPFMAPMMKGFGLEMDKLSNILGFYVIRNTPLILLMVSIFTILMSTSIFANEEFEKTAEFLYTRPLTRLEIFTAKVLACYTHIIIINIVVALIGFISMEAFKTQEYSKSAFLIHSVYGLFIAFAFSAVGFTIAALAKRGRGLFAMSIGIVLGTYFLDIISKVTPKAEFIGYISPFKYVDTDVLVANYTLHSGNILFFLLVTTILTVLAVRVFLRKDILY